MTRILFGVLMAIVSLDQAVVSAMPRPQDPTQSGQCEVPTGTASAGASVVSLPVNQPCPGSGSPPDIVIMCSGTLVTEYCFGNVYGPTYQMGYRQYCDQYGQVKSCP